MTTLKAQMAGGKARAKIQRNCALVEYYKSPKVCLYCGSVIPVKEHQKVSEVKKRSFCDHSCHATYAAKNRPRNERTHKERKSFDWSISKGELFSTRAWQNARSCIQRNARKIYMRSSKSMSCEHCGYTNHVEIAHIKSVSDFSDDTKITTINDISNLVALCPNHHWEFDNMKTGSGK